MDRFVFCLMAIIVIVLPTTQSFIHEVTFYSLPNQQGSQFTTDSSYTNVGSSGNISTVLHNVGSVCAVGVWYFYTTPDYRDYLLKWGTVGNRRICRNVEANSSTFSTVKSFGYFGPRDTSTPGFTATEYAVHPLNSGVAGCRFSNALMLGGKSVFYNNATKWNAQDFPFVPQYYVITGGQNWTFYTDPNFTGHAVCVIPSEDYVIYNNIFKTEVDTSVGSFKPGCSSTPNSVIKVIFDYFVEDWGMWFGVW